MTDPVVTTTYTTLHVKYTHYGTWNYFASFAVSFGYRAVPTNNKNCKVVRVWLDNVLMYDAYANLGDLSFIFYPGTEDQPFYRGQMVMFFSQLFIAEGAGIPAVTAEIVDNTPLGALVGTVYLSRSLTPAWGEYSADSARIVEIINDGGKLAVRKIVVATNSDGGTVYIVSSDVDLSQPVIFAPWYDYALAQNGAEKVLINTASTAVKIQGSLGGAGVTIATETDFPPALFGVAQNAGLTFTSNTTFFLLSSAKEGLEWPYQIANITNNKIVYGAGVGLTWTDEPQCMTRGARAGGNMASFSNQLIFGSVPPDSTGDVLIGFDYSVRKVTVGVAGSGAISRTTPPQSATVTDEEIYSHATSVGTIVRVYYTGTDIVLLIETSPVTHAGIARRIGYDGTIIWTSVSFDLDGITDKQLRTQQSMADLSTNRLGVVSAHTPNTYTLIDLDTGEILSSETWTGLTIDPSLPAFWIGSKDTFYPIANDASYIKVDLPEPTAIPLDEALTTLAMRAGYAAEDVIVSGLHDVTIQGYIVGANTTLGDILDNMSTIYQFSYAEVAGKLYIVAVFVDEVFASVIGIPETDLALLTEGQNGDQQTINLVLADDASLPLTLTVNYIDPAVDYQQNTQTAKRSNFPVPTTSADKTASFTVPIIAHGGDMLMRLYKALYATWAAQKTASIRLPSKYLALIPTDGFTFTALGFDHNVSAVSVTINADFSVSLAVVERAATSRAITVTSQEPSRPIAQGPVAPIRALLLDLDDTRYVQSTDDRLNLGVALSGYTAGQWVSGRLDIADATDLTTWATRVQTPVETPIGVITAIDQDTRSVVGYFETDYKTKITFELNSMPLSSLASATYAEMLAGANLMAMGRDGRFELIQFGTLVDNGDGTVTVSKLFRGRFGSEQVIPMLSVGDFVVQYDKLSFITYPLADFKNKVGYSYRGVVPSEDPEAAAQAFILPNGNSYRLRAPVQLKAIGPELLDEATLGSIDLSWRRRTRFFGEMIDSTSDVPLDEGRIFSLDLYRADQSGIALRVVTIDCTAELTDHYSFTAKQLTAAGYDSSPKVLYAYVYQVDAAHVGRGWGGGFKVVVKPVPPFVDFDADIGGELPKMGGLSTLNTGTAQVDLVVAGQLPKVSGSISLIRTNQTIVLSGALKKVSGSSAIHIDQMLVIGGALQKISGSVVIGDAVAIGALNPLDKATLVTLANSNYTAIKASGVGWVSVRSDTHHTSGKFYYEWNPWQFTGSFIAAGFANLSASLSNYIGSDSNGISLVSDGEVFKNGGGTGTLSGLGSGASGAQTLCSIAIDIGAGLFWVRQGTGNWNGSGTANPATGTGGIAVPSGMGSGAIAAALSVQAGGDQGRVNFGQASFSFTVPSGFSAWG